MSALLVAIEGIDGSGKGTQAKLVSEGLSGEGLSCGLIGFPRYDQTAFGRTIAGYLNGEFGDLQTAGAYFAALLYAGDRFESLPLIEQLHNSRDVVIFDRYVPSNLAHQAAKLTPPEREGFITWVESIEYGVYKLPRPDLVIWLDMPVDTAQQLIAQKPYRRYTQRRADLHEADGDYLTRTREVYRVLARQRTNWCVVSCCEANRLRSAASLQHEILQHIHTAFDDTTGSD